MIESSKEIGRTTPAASSAVPPLRGGDRLTRTEFERRYAAMPSAIKAELVEGVVYLMPSPVRSDQHGEPHFDLITWLGVYRARTPGVKGADNSTVRLDLDNEPQPDIFLRILPQCGGQSRTSAEGYVEGAPELVAEITASTASYDLHDKLNVYRRNGVKEYLVWRTEDRELDWFVLVAGCFEPLPVGEDGILRSGVFPGLWLDSSALLKGDLPRVLETLELGIANPAHHDFVARLAICRPPGT